MHLALCLHKLPNMCVQALGDKLSQSRFVQPFEPQAEAGPEPYSADVPSKSVAVSRRGSGMPFLGLKTPAASRRGSATAAGLLEPDISNEVSTLLCGVGKSSAISPCLTEHLTDQMPTLSKRLVHVQTTMQLCLFGEVLSGY